MSAHTRTRLPAALCVLLLLTFGSIAHAGMPGRPIDRSEGPPDTEPVMVGDPDEPPSVVIVPFLNRVFVFRITVGMRRSAPVLRGSFGSNLFGRPRQRVRAPNAR
jgi:hypothetical protein